MLFTLMAQRYERRSMLITSNLVFSEWERIFKNPMTTAAAIDRLVHHSVILEFDVPSFRTEDAKKRTAPPVDLKKAEEAKKEEKKTNGRKAPRHQARARNHLVPTGKSSCRPWAQVVGAEHALSSKSFACRK